MAKERLQFCIECREETMYRIHHVLCTNSIKGKEYFFRFQRLFVKNVVNP